MCYNSPMKHFYSLSDHYKEKFGCKVYKLSISGGMTCPNRDGTLGTRGCVFCSAGGSGEFAAPCSLSVTEQLNEAKKRVQTKVGEGKYTDGSLSPRAQLEKEYARISAKNGDAPVIVYFQANTNTYAPAEYLSQIYREAIAPDDIVGLSIATRPDCLGGEVMDVIGEINRIKPVMVELGLQTIHESTAEYIRRGYPLPVYDDAVRRLKEIGVETVTHLIIGLPGESARMMLESVRYVGQVTDGIKLQLLHVIEGTDLAADYHKGRFDVLSLEAYADIICRSIELLPPNVVIHRMTGDGAKRSLIAPMWSADKKRVLNYINRMMDERGTVQGSKTRNE